MSIVGHIVWWLKYSLAFLAKVAQVYFSIYKKIERAAGDAFADALALQ